MGSDVLQPPHYDVERPDFSGIAECADVLWSSQCNQHSHVAADAWWVGTLCSRCPATQSPLPSFPSSRLDFESGCPAALAPTATPAARGRRRMARWTCRGCPSATGSCGLRTSRFAGGPTGGSGRSAPAPLARYSPALDWKILPVPAASPLVQTTGRATSHAQSCSVTCSHNISQNVTHLGHQKQYS